MTMDKSLRIRAGSTSSRNVLTRAERIEQMKGADTYNDATSPYGLPKTRVVKLSMKKKKKVKEEEGDDKAKGAKPAAGAKAPAAAAGAKPPAAAAKPAAKK